MRRALLTIEEFNAMAFGRSARSSTISTRNVWRAGISKEFTIP
jgi:hypothetical protein